MSRKNPFETLNTVPRLLAVGATVGAVCAGLIANEVTGGGGPNGFEKIVEAQAANVVAGHGTPSLTGLNPIVIPRGANKNQIEFALRQAVAVTQEFDQKSEARIACIGAAVTAIDDKIVFAASTRAELGAADSSSNADPLRITDADNAYRTCVNILVAGAVNHAEEIPGGLPSINMALPPTSATGLAPHGTR
jgi:hypothetical protein